MATTQSLNQLLNEQYGHIFNEELIVEIERIGTKKEFKQGEEVMTYGQPIVFVPLVLQGALKILRQKDSGDELLLYFIETGDTCAMTLNCCMGKGVSEIRAVVEKDATMVLVPVEEMIRLSQKYEGWMQFVFESYYQRTNELIEAIDSLAFLNLPERLTNYLKNKAIVSKSTLIDATHLEIATDLHSSRVVISRLLKKMEKEERIRMTRNQIELLDF